MKDSSSVERETGKRALSKKRQTIKAMVVKFGRLGRYLHWIYHAARRRTAVLSSGVAFRTSRFDVVPARFPKQSAEQAPKCAASSKVRSISQMNVFDGWGQCSGDSPLCHCRFTRTVGAGPIARGARTPFIKIEAIRCRYTHHLPLVPPPSLPTAIACFPGVRRRSHHLHSRRWPSPRPK